MKKELVNFKKYVTTIIPMDNATFNLSLDFLNIKEIKRGEFFIREGKTCNYIAYISEGLFRIFYLKDGNEINTCFCFENSITSSFESFINRKESIEYIQALEDAIIVTLSYKNLKKLNDLSFNWQSFSKLLSVKECLRLTDRVRSLSFETAIDKYKTIIRYQPEIIKRISIQHIASYIGVSRETLSRIRSKISSE